MPRNTLSMNQVALIGAITRQQTDKKLLPGKVQGTGLTGKLPYGPIDW